MIMAKCSFCGKEIPQGRGKVFAKNDGKVFRFCNSKCNKNFNMGRQGKSVKWTDTYHQIKSEEKAKSSK